MYLILTSLMAPCLRRRRSLASQFIHYLQLFFQYFLSKLIFFKLRFQIFVLILKMMKLKAIIGMLAHRCTTVQYQQSVLNLTIRQKKKYQKSLMQSKLILKKLKSVFPQLCHGARKGENGRVAVIGGSFQFTGAPYYSAISALRVGGDLSHIFCSKFSSPAIKSYSPQIIVHPLFVSEQEIKYEEKQVSLLINQWGIKLKSWQKAIHSWVIGPGLGRDRYMQQFFPHLVKSLPNGCLAIFDADAIYYLCLNPHLFDELKRIKAILTPNHRQLTFLQKHFKIDVQDILKNHDSKQEIIQLPNSYSNPYFKLVIKDRHDIILGNDTSFILKTEGGKKRCGGMGDILGGVMSVCALWDYSYGPALASRIVKLATRTAYEKHGRGLTAPYVINQLTSIVKNIESEIL